MKKISLTRIVLADDACDPSIDWHIKTVKGFEIPDDNSGYSHRKIIPEKSKSDQC
jgi:hypothetical protein